MKEFEKAIKMKYKERYMEFDDKEELMEAANDDMILALALNFPWKIKNIREAANEVIEERWEND